MRTAIFVSAAILMMVVPTALAHQQVPAAIVAKIPPRIGSSKPTPTQIELGRKLFNNETFGGNGRTCATCHAAEENFALSPADVRARPATDPLFVFERVPELATLENGPALRERALITENVDGFGQPGVLRSVPHIFALGLTTRPQATHPLVAALGWGGDGSPGDGSLRNFAVGAVVQHFTKRLDRVLGVDFRMPTDVELNALEAFQLSIGRRVDPVVDPGITGHLVFPNADVTAGQDLFAGMTSRNGNGRRCSGCHTGGGALNDVGENEQRANGNELTPGAPACFFTIAPGDDGFAPTPTRIIDRAEFCVPEDDGDGDPQFPVPPLLSGPVPFLGNQFFSTQSTVEAADTPPFFHDNSAQTIEEVVAFYDSDAFNDSITGAGNGFIIPTQARNQISLFLRVLNTLENIRSSITGIDAHTKVGTADAKRDIRDAITVLQQGVIRPYDATALPALKRAKQLLGSSPDLARVELIRARAAIVNSDG